MGSAWTRRRRGEAAALATRERKQYGIDTHTWREEVQARAGELGLGRDEITELLETGRERLARGSARSATRASELALGDQLAGPHGLTERANTFDERAVLQEFAAAAGQGASVAEVRAQAERFLARDDVLVTAQGFTTVELVECERRLIDAAVGRADEGVGVARRRGRSSV